MKIEELAKRIIKQAIALNATDIYLLPLNQQEYYEVKVRCQTKLLVLKQLNYQVANKLILYLKYQANMDVAEKRKVQLGAINTKDWSLRLSTVSNYYQFETMVIRILLPLVADNLHYQSNLPFQQLKQNILRRGLHLFSGPVGSGKTTLMYYLAKQVAQYQQVITIEDPVEIEEEAFLQLQVQPKINLTYEALIKLCLRHRPDIMIIGEIRDDETATNAIRAALTGHSVFATVHARDIQGVYLRLQELNVNRIDLEECLQSIMRQCFLNLYCPFCLGECKPYCSRYKQNQYVFLEQYLPHEQTQKGMKDVLLWAWKIGAITEATYLANT